MNRKLSAAFHYSKARWRKLLTANVLLIFTHLSSRSRRQSSAISAVERKGLRWSQYPTVSINNQNSQINQ